MTRACLIHALHPDENESVILRISYVKPGLMRVGVEAAWRVAGSKEGGRGERDGAATPEQEGPRMLSGWDRDMPAVRGKPARPLHARSINPTKSIVVNGSKAAFYGPISFLSPAAVNNLPITLSEIPTNVPRAVDILLCPKVGACDGLRLALR